MKQLSGVIPPVITPVDECERVDEGAFRALIEHSIVRGLHGIFVCGSNGESLALTQGERDRAIQIALDQAAGRVPVIAGAMDASTLRVIENIKRLEQMGGTYAVVTPVFYARHTAQDEIVRHFEAISNETKAQLMIYNIPPFTGETIQAKTVFRLAEMDRVVGYKDSSGRFADFIKCLQHFEGTDFMLFQGVTNLSGPGLLLGADGFVPSLAPLFPGAHLSLYEAGRRGDVAETKRWGRIVDEMCEIYAMAKDQTAATKYAMSRLGILNPRVIRPTIPVTKEEARAIDARIERFRAYL